MYVAGYLSSEQENGSNNEDAPGGWYAQQHWRRLNEEWTYMV